MILTVNNHGEKIMAENVLCVYIADGKLHYQQDENKVFSFDISLEDRIDIRENAN